jgi:prophage DNA circulation protein
MATWQKLVERQPSFKGIPFNCKAVETEFGRKLNDNSEGGLFNFSSITGGGSDEKKATTKRPSFVDNGLLPKKIVVTIEFSGDEYNVTRDAFMDAVEAGGAGKLVLPTYNVYTNALAEKGTMRFTDQRGGIESCSVTFVILGELTSPTKAPNTKSKVKAAAASSKASGTSDFSTNSIVSGVESVFDEVVSDVVNFFSSCLAWLKSGKVKDDETYDNAVSKLNEINDQRETLAADPAAQANAYNEFLEDIGNAFSTAESGVAALFGIASTYAGKIQVVTGVGPLAISRTKNRYAGLIFIQNACLSNIALLLSELEFAVVDDVQQLREDFTSAVRSLQSTIGIAGGYAETYRDLVRLNAAVFNDLVQRSAALPVLEDRTLTIDTPALYFAFQKYGDADRTSEILTRNDIKRSLFASGDIEVLSR